MWERWYAGPWRVVRRGMRVAADASLPACARLSVSARRCLDTPDRGWNHPHGRPGFISSSSPSFSGRTLTPSISVLVSPLLVSVLFVFYCLPLSLIFLSCLEWLKKEFIYFSRLFLSLVNRIM